jgi:hypothetical protein
MIDAKLTAKEFKLIELLRKLKHARVTIFVDEEITSVVKTEENVKL